MLRPGINQMMAAAVALFAIVLSAQTTPPLSPNPALPQAPATVYHPEADELKPAAQEMTEGDWGEAVRLLNPILEENPDHLEARYLRAIAHRERAKLRTLRAKASNQWQKGIADFEYIIQRDSSYRDVLYQYALYSRVQKRQLSIKLWNLDQNVSFTDAILLGHAQIRHRPDVSEHLFHLFTFYRRYIHHSDPEDALAWLREHPSDYARYFRGEVFRLDGRLQKADDIFADLLDRDNLDLPRQSILLSRARVHYALDRPERAQQFVRQAIEAISRPIEAAFVFEDVKYIVSNNDLATYRSLETAEEYIHFFREFWAQRDPMPARPVNVRLEEHYHRLLTAEEKYWYDGFRLWRNSPDKVGALTFPPAYKLNHEFNDKGLIYIRHGEPADRVVTVEGAMNSFNTTGSVLPEDVSVHAGWVPNESWRYTYTDEPMTFHFVIAKGATGNNWRLTLALTNASMVLDREYWGGVYAQMADAAREILSRQGRIPGAAYQAPGGPGGASANFSTLTDFTTARAEMAKKSRNAVDLGMTTDRHTWSEDVEPFEIPYVMTTFRGAGGQTSVELYYALPADELLDEAGAEEEGLTVETGWALHDAAWQLVHQDRATNHIESSQASSDDPSYSFQFTAPPDSYHVALHSRALHTNLLGGYKFDYRVPDYSSGEFAISDLLLADSITPVGESSGLTRGDLQIDVNVRQEFSVDDPLFVYFEIYQLALDADDRTKYTIEYTLSPDEDDRGFFGRLFGGGTPAALSLTFSQAGREPSPVEYAEIDISAVDPGSYTLAVTVTDELTGETITRSREVELTE